MGEERRRYDRSSSQEAQIACTTAEHARPGGPSPNLAVRLLDTSATGACLITKERLREGLEVVIGIVLPGAKSRVTSPASVRWSTTIESKGRIAHVAGVEFEKPVAEFAPSLP